MRKVFLVVLVSVFVATFGALSLASAVSAPSEKVNVLGPSLRSLEGLMPDRLEKPLFELPEVFEHGDCSWIPPVALAAGWKKAQLPKLLNVIARESGCCPRRIGGSQVDANCQLVKMWDQNHPSDSGLLQLNGVHWKPDHPQYHGLFCKKANICTQEPLLDAFTNLKMGKMLFDVAGWSPWNPIN